MVVSTQLSSPPMVYEWLMLHFWQTVAKADLNDIIGSRLDVIQSKLIMFYKVV